MPDQSPIYELTLLLSTEADEDVRTKILAEVEAAIERGGGSVVKKTAWGTRSLAYRIDREDDAEFHLFEITAPPALLTELSHNLRITDGVLRSRIIKAIASPQGRAAEEPAAAGTSGRAAEEPAAARASGRAAEEPAGARASGRAAEEPAAARTSETSDPDSSSVRESVSPERGSI